MKAATLTRARLLLVAAALAFAVAVLQGPALGASSTVVVTATIPSATNMSNGTCVSGTPGVTDLGTMLPGDVRVTSDCTITFGSTNDQAMLRIGQADRAGTAMFRWSSGARDTAPSGAGGVTVDLGGLAQHQEARAVEQLPDGRIVVAGRAVAGANNNGFVARFTTAGTLDPTFNAGAGWIALDLGDLEEVGYWGGGLDVAPDGSIYVAGSRRIGPTWYRGMVAKYTSAGVLDTSFGTGGVATINTGDEQDRLTDVEVHPDGRIIALGDHYVQATSDSQMLVVALRPDGQLDQSFGTGGWYRTARANNQSLWRIDVAENGAVFGVGGDYNGGVADALVVKLTPAGAPDASFAGGIVNVHWSIVANQDVAYGVAVTHDNKLLVVGSGLGGDSGVARLNANGTLDTAFDTDGMRLVDAGQGNVDGAWDVMALGDGRAMFAGQRTVGGFTDSLTVRLTPSGQLDTTWDGDGIRNDAMSAGANDFFYDIEPGIDGDVVAAGFANQATQDVTAVQYAGTQLADYVPTTTDWNDGAATFGACLFSVGAGTTAQWTAAASCPTADAAQWNAVPPATAKVAYANASLVTTATATVRFGARMATNQAPGSYLAPVVFETLAPNA